LVGDDGKGNTLDILEDRMANEAINVIAKLVGHEEGLGLVGICEHGEQRANE